MIRVRGRAVTYGELWLDEPPPADAGVDILVYRYRSTPIADARNSPLHSLRTDLTPPGEAILARFDETCRRQIRRAGREDALRYEMSAEPAADLAEFIDFYDVFARQKGLWLADRHWLTRAAEARQLALSRVVRNGETLVWHAHLCAGRTAQLAHSASWFRGADGDHRSLVARANRWLHWQDMLAFKAAGLLHYDWGGMFAQESTPERAGINRFKRAFGGTPVLAYECSIPVTLRGRMWLTLRGLLRRDAQRPRPEAASAA
ncbi:MAG TPA: GNAT family N-acetyltransferase [Steroidobacteraceae bacterium]|nr:GNAT family N-acetyltransferase [Steroidobacteraceae bacterium]